MSVSNMTPGGIVTLACVLEVSAPKPGNIHRNADFEDATLDDFLSSAVAVGQAIDRCAQDGLGQTVLSAVQATKAIAGTNTNLGMILLLVPLAKIKHQGGEMKPDAIESLLAGLTASDAEQVYEAIRLAQPGGLGAVDQMDVADPEGGSPDCLLQAMKLAEDKDMIARQYGNGFQQVFESAAAIVRNRKTFPRVSEAIVLTHLETITAFGDSLIARKCGPSASKDAQTRAQSVLSMLPETGDSVDHEQFWNAVGDFDFWLRSDGHRRNPGTTADMIAAGLFVGLSAGEILPPFS